MLEYGADPKIKNLLDETAYDLVGRNSWYGATEADKVAIRELLENENRPSQQLKRGREEEDSLDNEANVERENVERELERPNKLART